MKNCIVKGLCQCLAESYTIYLNTQKCHWNVEGPNFHSLHIMFEGQYKILADYVDILAERIRGLESYAPGSFSEFEELSEVSQIEGFDVQAEEMIRILLNGYGTLIETMKKTAEKAEKKEDSGTSDILIGQIEQHEKTVWMLRSTLKKDGR